MDAVLFYLGVCFQDFKQRNELPVAARMARDMSDKEILKMELDQLKKEVNTPRSAVSK